MRPLSCSAPPLHDRRARPPRRPHRLPQPGRSDCGRLRRRPNSRPLRARGVRGAGRSIRLPDAPRLRPGPLLRAGSRPAPSAGHRPRGPALGGPQRHRHEPRREPRPRLPPGRQPKPSATSPRNAGPRTSRSCSNAATSSSPANVSWCRRSTPSSAACSRRAR